MESSNNLGQCYDPTRQEMLEFIPTKSTKLLDVGCGTGAFLNAYKKINPVSEVWGIEISPEASSIAKNNLDVVLCGDVNDMFDKLPDKKFDVIIFNDILEHLYDPFQLLKEVQRKLSTRGVVISSIPNFRFILNLKEIIIAKDWKYTKAGILDFTHIRFFTTKSIIRLFEDAGYSIARIQGINPIKSLKFNIFNLVTFGFFQDTKYIQIAVVTKPIYKIRQ